MRRIWIKSDISVGEEEITDLYFLPKKVRLMHPNWPFRFSAFFFTNIWRSLKPSLARGRGAEMSLNPGSTVLENGHFSVPIRVENRTQCIWQWIYNWGWWLFWTAKMCLMSVSVAISFGLDLLFQNINRKWDEFGLNRIFQWGRRKLQICIFDQK